MDARLGDDENDNTILHNGPLLKVPWNILHAGRGHLEKIGPNEPKRKPLGLGFIRV